MLLSSYTVHSRFLPSLLTDTDQPSSPQLHINRSRHVGEAARLPAERAERRVEEREVGRQARDVEAVVRRLARECERRGLRAAIEPAPDLPEEEYEGGTFAKHPGGMVHVWVRRGGGGEEAAGATIRGGVDGTNAG